MSDSSPLHDIEALFGALPVGACVLDRELRFVRANARYAETVRVAVDKLVGRRLVDVLTEPARSRAEGIARQVLETGEPFRGAERREPGDAPSPGRIWRVSAHPIFEEGEVVGVLAVVLDITDVRLSEEEASAALKEVESVYRNAPVGLSLVDRDLRYLRVNQAIADMNGRSIEEIVGRTYREVSPETADTAEPLLRGLMERGKSVRNLEVRSRPPGDPDREHVYLLSMEPIRDEKGAVAGHTSVVQDVTDLRQVEATAAERLEQLEILYEHSLVGLCHMDPDLLVVQLNPQFGELCIRPVSERVGAHAATLFPEEISERLLPQLSFVARSGRSSVGLELRGRAAGSHHETTWIAQTHPILSPNREVAGIVTVAQDVTEFAELRREAETVRDRLAEAQKVAHFGSWEWNLLDDEVWWSREFYEIVGEAPSYVPTYSGYFERVHPDDRVRVRAQTERILQSNEAGRATYRILRPDGSERTLFSIARLERAETGEPARMIGTVQDVTDFHPTESLSD
ncbi:MAG: PAS domain-containing protein [Myxococcota bacterium]